MRASVCVCVCVSGGGEEQNVPQLLLKNDRMSYSYCVTQTWLVLVNLRLIVGSILIRHIFDSVIFFFFFLGGGRAVACASELNNFHHGPPAVKIVLFCTVLLGFKHV